MIKTHQRMYIVTLKIFFLGGRIEVIINRTVESNGDYQEARK